MKKFNGAFRCSPSLMLLILSIKYERKAWTTHALSGRMADIIACTGGKTYG